MAESDAEHENSPADDSLTYRERLCAKDNERFRKYIESTSTHGVAHVFTGKSKIRRFFWLLVVLGAAAGCLSNIVDRILYFASEPTATTLSVSRQERLTFPAVTVCNLNLIRRSYLESLGPGAADLFKPLLNVYPGESRYTIAECTEDLKVILNFVEKTYNTSVPFSFRTATVDGGHLFDFFVVDCVYQGVNCKELPYDPWSRTFTRLGLCYTFNAGESDDSEPLKVNGTGTSHGLSLILNIQQDEYIFSSSGDAGVKLSIHPQGTPSEPDYIGIAIPPGRNAFIGMRERRIRDRSGKGRCKKPSENDDFNFLGSEYEYSVSACSEDCFLTNVADNCGCVDNSRLLVGDSRASGPYSNLPNCGQEHTCCLLNAYTGAHGCGALCEPACEYSEYTTAASYSAYPARYLIDPLITLIEPLYTNATNATLPAADLTPSLNDVYRIYENVSIDQDYLENNILSVNIYFEDLNLEEETTEDAYSITALFSEIGGLLGLFVGVSVISLIEFGVWVLDEIKDRCLGMMKLWRWVKRTKNDITSPTTDIEMKKMREAEKTSPF